MQHQDGEGSLIDQKLDQNVQYLKGVGPKWLAPMAKVGLRTVRDLLQYYPRRYEDRRHLPPIRQVRVGQQVTVRGFIKRLDSRTIRGGRVIIKAILSDATGSIALTWFNQPWIKKRLSDYHGELIAYGTVKETTSSYEIASPEIELINDEADAEDFARIVPVYPLTDGLPQIVVRRAVQSALLETLDVLEDPIPVKLRSAWDIEPLAWSILQIHRPDSDENRQKARKRLVFEEFLYMQIALHMRRRETKQEVGIKFDLTQIKEGAATSTSLFEGEVAKQAGEDLWSEVRRMLPFELTKAQVRVINDIWADMQIAAPMNRLVQGDVGSGKTAVAACAMLAAVRCGYQAALMAPTEILAEQHYAGLTRLFERVGITTTLLHGKLPAAKRRKAEQMAESGQASIVVGTHAMIQDSIKFHRLGLAVIDEQHRFGVLQRAALRRKGADNPDVLVMTATPIPRTLTMTLYGDLDVSVIDELPPGRKTIKTHWKLTHERPQVYEIVRKLVSEGRQAYFVCPMIADSDKMQTQAAEDLFYRLSTDVYKDYRIGLLHGQMKSTEKEAVMDSFRRHELDILVSTVVIEVGVDVPNASVIVIEDANRFGLAQLHQLRGRVGRGDTQSFCVLIADAATDETAERLGVIRDTTDGFKIADADLRLRGPGDVAGTRQSGALDFRLANLALDTILLESARKCAIELLDNDPNLDSISHRGILARVRARRMETAVATIS